VNVKVACELMWRRAHCQRFIIVAADITSYTHCAKPSLIFK